MSFNRIYFVIILFLLLGCDQLYAQWSYVLMSQGRYNPSITTAAEKVFLAGGVWDLPGYYYDVYDGNTNSWNHYDLPHKSQYTGLGSLGNKVYFALQKDQSNQFSDIVDVYDVKKNTWSQDHVSLARSSMTIQSLSSKILFAGGYPTTNNKVLSNRVDIYDTLLQAWRIDTLSVPRSDMVSCVAANKIFFAGGAIVKNGTISYTDVVDVYDGGTDSWSTIKLPVVKGLFAMVASGDSIFFAGGTKADNTITDVINIYDISTNTWTENKLSSARYGLAGAAVGNQVMFAGGTTISDRPKTVDVLNLLTGQWSVDNLFGGRSGLVGITLGNKVLFAGGIYGPAPSALVDLYISNCTNNKVTVASSFNICKGYPGVLTASGTSAYSWSPSTGLSATTGSSVTANPATTTMYEVTGIDVAGCKTKAYTTVNVDPVPVMTVYPSAKTICAGETVRLTPSNVVITTWSPSTGLTAINTTEVFAKPMETITYTVIGKNYPGCSDTATVVISVKPSPSVDVSADKQVMCAGESAVLTATGNANSYSWIPTTDLSATTGLEVEASPSQTITYKIIGEGENNCTDTATVDVIVFPIPEQPNIYLLPASANTIFSSSETGNQWYKDGAPIEGANDSFFEAFESGSYSLIITDNNCASPMSIPMDIVISGIETIIQNNLVYPNPVSDMLVINLQSFSPGTNVFVKVVDALGRTMIQTSSPDAENVLDVRSLKQGLYWLHAAQGSHSIHTKFEKK
jgi:hypothetical protein